MRARKKNDLMNVMRMCVCVCNCSLRIDFVQKKKKIGLFIRTSRRKLPIRLFVDLLDKHQHFVSIDMNSSKAEAENIEPSAGKEMLDKYWAEIKNEIEDINIVSHRDDFFQTKKFVHLQVEFRTTDLPLARIKKIMKLDDDVKMISAEVPILFAKAAELFIQELTIHSWLQTEESRRRTLQVDQRSDDRQ